MILADTTVWQAWLPRSRVPDPVFTDAIRDQNIVCHPWILGELLLGGVAPAVAERIQTMDFLPLVPEESVYTFIRQYRPQGVGWVDVNLLVACIQADVLLWTKDRDLHANARKHGRAYER